MTIKTTLLALATTTALFAVGCGNKAPAPTTNASPTPAAPAAAAPATPAAAAAAAPAAGAVTTYPTQVPQSGTKKIIESFTVYSAADPSSTVLTHLGKGTMINLKASYGNFMEIDYPSGVGQLSPGWIELKDPTNDPRLEHSPAATGLVTPKAFTNKTQGH